MNNIYISIDNNSSASELPEDEDPPSWIAACLQFSQVQLALQNRPAAVSITYLENHEAQKLNATYRDKDYATNVLSFPADLPDFITSVDDGFTLGDLIICPSVVQREAQEQGKNTIHHFTHLVIHGFLHLLGFDHINESEADAMESLESKILAKLGIANPYNESPHESERFQTSPQMETI